jgi:phosphoribosylformimino-5-aminoimidazole carboxamide ribotide isomerase
VLGSESQADESLLERFRDRVILSLDFFADGFRGPPRLLGEPALWPDTVIVMTLAKVGSGAGPDLGRLADVKARAEGRAVVAAGGVRNAADLETLARLGIAAALVATALHDGTLAPGDIAAFDPPAA